MFKFASSLLLAAVGVRAMELDATQTQLLDLEIARALEDGYTGPEAPSSGHFIPKDFYSEVVAGTTHSNVASCIHYNPHAATDATNRYCSHIYGIQSALRNHANWAGKNLSYIVNMTARWLEVLSHDAVARGYRNELYMQENMQLNTTKNECIEALDETTSECESLNATLQGQISSLENLAGDHADSASDLEDQISALVNEATTAAAAAGLTGFNIANAGGVAAIEEFITQASTTITTANGTIAAALSAEELSTAGTVMDLETVAEAAVGKITTLQAEAETAADDIAAALGKHRMDLAAAASEAVRKISSDASTITTLQTEATTAATTLSTAVDSGAVLDLTAAASTAATTIGDLEAEVTTLQTEVTTAATTLSTAVDSDAVLDFEAAVSTAVTTIADLKNQVAALQSQVTAVANAAVEAVDAAQDKIDDIETKEHDLVEQIQAAKDEFDAVNTTDPIALYEALKEYTQFLADRFVTLDELLSDEIEAHLAYQNASAKWNATWEGAVAACESKYELCESRRGESDQEIEEVKTNLEGIVELYGNTYMQAAADFGNYSEYLAEPSTDEWDLLMAAKTEQVEEMAAAAISDNTTTTAIRVEKKKSLRANIRPVSFGK